MNAPYLNVAQLNFDRQQRTLLSNIEFNIQAGELVGIIGPNGAGKSTLLKCIVGINTSPNAVIEVQGQPISHLDHTERAQRLSYLAQHQQAPFAFTAQQAISLGAFSRVVPAKVNNQQVLDIANQLGIQQLLQRKMDELSGGETQLVHFARILHQQAPLMLLDEPTASLDIGHEAQLMNLLKQQCQQGRSALVAIHNLNVAAAFCDRLILLDKGRIVSIGQPDQVITQQHMAQLYNQVIVSQNPITGSVTVLPMTQSTSAKAFTVHLIGGAGSAVALSRSLLQMGVQVTAGVAHEQDTDTDYWQATGVEHVKVAAFSAIDEKAVKAAQKLVHAADVTILCEFPIGIMNQANLAVAQAAKNLWLLNDANAVATSGRFANDKIKADFLSATEHGHKTSTLEAIARIQQQLQAIE